MSPVSYARRRVALLLRVCRFFLLSTPPLLIESRTVDARILEPASPLEMRRERPPANARRRTPDDDDDDDMSGATFAQRWLRPEVCPIATRRDATTTTTRP